MFFVDGTIGIRNAIKYDGGIMGLRRIFMAYLFIGSYSPAGEEGIRLYRFFAEGDGAFEQIGGFSDVVNPSFLTVDAVHQRLYAVSETAQGSVVSLRYDVQTGAIEEVNRQPVMGDDPCYLILDESGQWLLLVNYSSGSINLYPVDAEGAIGALAQQVQHEGHSLRMDRQEAAHPHSIHQIRGTSYFLVPDLGLDQVVTYRLDAAQGKLVKVAAAAVTPGSGPRHLAFHPTAPYVYVIHELSCEVEVFHIDVAQGTLTSIQKISTLLTENSDNTCAEVAIHADGTWLYGSNRGDDSLIVYRVEAPDQLQVIDRSSTAGQWPRHFAIVPHTPYILAANQLGNNIVVMKVGEQGVPIKTGQEIQMPKPVCIKIF